MKKTGEFWLNCLSDDIREKWLDNYDPNYYHVYKDYAIPLSDYLRKEMTFTVFMTEAFNWYCQDFNQGWYKIYLSMNDETKLIQQLRNNKLKPLGL